MAYDEQLDIREITRDGVSGRYELEFPYNEDFISSLKAYVPSRDRAYDEDTHIWTIFDGKYLPRIVAMGLNQFKHVTKKFRRGEETVFLNCRTGFESVQKGLFSKV